VQAVIEGVSTYLCRVKEALDTYGDEGGDGDAANRHSLVEVPLFRRIEL
jgi:hypothetical protein